MDTVMRHKILTVGVFDYFHYGHLRLFNQIKIHYPKSYLMVAVQHEDFILRYKPGAVVFYSTEIRCELVRSLRQVDRVITYQAVAEIVREIDFDIFAVGEDQNHSGFQEAMAYCLKNDKGILHLSRTANISSTMMKGNFEFRRHA